MASVPLSSQSQVCPQCQENFKEKLSGECVLTIISQIQKELVAATELVNDESQASRMVPGTK